MDIGLFIAAGLLCLSPLGELRAGMPLLFFKDVNPVLVYFFCVAINLLVSPIVLLFVNTFHKLFLRFRWYKKFSEKVIERARVKVKEKVDKYGFIGLAIFVAIPLPLTGAYTGALGAWILGMDMKKAFLSVSLGVAVAGLLVLLVCYLIKAGVGFLGFLLG